MDGPYPVGSGANLENVGVLLGQGHSSSGIARPATGDTPHETASPELAIRCPAAALHARNVHTNVARANGGGR